uniref:IS1634 family transposase n=1 Tax=Fodinicola feengrottensis TaxID=435914 RepID=UPI002441F4A6|nr:transposase [Fodinicola feengrottensis]
MDRLSVADLRAIETKLGRRIVTEFGLDLTGLVLDMTNFATFIDSGNEKAPIAQRGRAKQKRVDLRLVGLGLVVTRDGGGSGAVPYLSGRPAGCHPVQRDDRRTGRPVPAADYLRGVADDRLRRRAEFRRQPRTGGGYRDRVHRLLPPSDHPALLAIPKSRYRPVDADGDAGRYRGLTHVDTTVTALGVTRRAVLTHSTTLHAKQVRGLDQTLATVTGKLTALQGRLARGRTRKSRAAVQTEIATICRHRWVSDIITTTLTGDKPAELRLTWRTDRRARTRLENRIFGKRILFTGHDDWPVTDIVAGYRSQSDVEAGFRQLKDTHVVSFSPMHHWTDQKIRVHVFYCVLALTIAHLMRREAEHADIHMSVRELLNELSGIQETVLLYHDGNKGRPRAKRMLTDMTWTQQKLADLFNIHHYAPTR